MADPTPSKEITLIRQGQPTIVPTGLRNAPLSDLYYFLMTTSWTKFVMLFIALYLALNATFAIAFLLTGAKILNADPDSFIDALFFSIQTMSTIGYGHLAPGDIVADTLVAVESVIGLLGMAMVTGLIFAKFARPKPRIIFSRAAVIASRDGVRSLIFRAANERTNQIIDARMRATYTFTETTPEGEPVRRFIPLELQRPDSPVFSLAWQGTHAIDTESPFFQRSASDLAVLDAEVIVSVAGVDQDLAHPIHASHSYRVDGLRHGCRLADMFYERPDGTRIADFKRFHEFKEQESIEGR